MLELFKIVGKIALEGQDAVTKALSNVERNATSADQKLLRLGDGMQAVGRKTTAAGKTMSKFSAGIGLVAGAAFGLVSKVANMGDQVAKNSRQVGMSIQEYQQLDYALQQVAKVGTADVERALGRLNTRIGQAAEGNTKYTEALAQVGYSQAEIEAGTITSAAAFDKLIVKLKATDTDAEAAGIAAGLLGDRIGRQLGPALRQGGEQVDVLRKQFVDLGLGISDKAALASEKFNDSMDTLKKQLGAVAISIGSDLLPVFQSFVEWMQSDGVPIVKSFAGVLTGIAQAFAALPGPVQNFLAIAAGLLTVLGPILLVVGKVVTVLGALTKAFVVVKVAMLTLAPSLAPLLVAFGPIIAIVAAVAAGIYLLVKAVQAIVKHFGGWEAAGKKLAESLKAAWESIKEGFTKVIEFVSAGVEKIIQFYIDLYSKIWDVISSGGAKIIEMFTQFWTGVYALWSNGVQSVIEIVTQFVSGVIERIAQMPGQVVAVIRSMVEAVVNYFSQMGSMALNAVKNMVMNVVNYVKNMAQNVIASIEAMFQAVVGNSIVPDMVDGVLDEFSSMTDGAVRDTRGLVKGVNSELDGLPENVSPEVSMQAGGGQGRGAAGGVTVDMRHAIIRDDKDMLDRMRRRGLEMSGAF